MCVGSYEPKNKAQSWEILNEAKLLWSEITSILCVFMVMNFGSTYIKLLRSFTFSVRQCFGMLLISWYLMYEWESKALALHVNISIRWWRLFILTFGFPQRLCQLLLSCHQSKRFMQFLLRMWTFFPHFYSLELIAWQYFMHRWRWTMDAFRRNKATQLGTRRIKDIHCCHQGNFCRFLSPAAAHTQPCTHKLKWFYYREAN